MIGFLFLWIYFWNITEFGVKLIRKFIYLRFYLSILVNFVVFLRCLHFFYNFISLVCNSVAKYIKFPFIEYKSWLTMYYLNVYYNRDISAVLHGFYHPPRRLICLCWKFQGKTGFPWIDAIMTQLRQEGWIHHLARHAVACFLTRGDLWISWEEGMKVWFSWIREYF